MKIKAKDLKKMMDKLKENYVFYKEAIELMEKIYQYDSARSKLYQLTKAGTIEKIELYNVPTLYNKSDILTVVNK
jgi:hypothetical protein